MPGAENWAALQAGVALGLASTASIGPNNLMLIREGLSGGRPGTVATAVCTSYGALLAGACLLADSTDMLGQDLRAWLGWSGFAVICCFAVIAFRSAAQVGAVAPDSGQKMQNSCVSKAISVIWLNPLTYLEYLVIPATVCATFPSTDDRLRLAASALLVTVLASCGYAYAGRLMAPVLLKRTTMRAFDLVSGLLLTAIAIAMGVALLDPPVWLSG